ncbi:phenylacetate--CoA ligase family protein [Plantibacter sp. CFBP 8775]|uniref:phenylacetate--CoA ligase family protein n=1 Tax=Plantibacter sp. CFBP 8775 TaxID=2774038 RepID=UPI00177E6F10|nr:phenylacetate--CoA ligase family protein [Plantibacter sp. CFBP 8775]MBD8101906.1 phenylacetate--CoA ligase family protein [Plantibacter sp. CFBP 8775]
MSFPHTVLALKRGTVLRSSDRLDRQLERDERLDPDALAALSAERSIAHARFAMEHSPFYRERYGSAGFTLDDLRDPAAFDELPIIEKADVREHAAAFRTPEADDRTSAVSTTGGSTGEPLRLLRDLRFPARALEWRLFRWWGVDPSDNTALLSRHVKSARAELKHAAAWWPSRRIQLDANHMDPEHVDRFVEGWQRIRPKALVGYVGGIAELARLLDERGLSIAAPTAVAVTAAPITPAQRELIGRVFRAPVYDHYRSAEIPWMGGECSAHDGLHVFSDVRTLDLVDESDRPVPDGTVGQVVFTDLTNRVFPLVRYRLGDRTARMQGECSCGVTLPRITAVVGRVSEALHLPDGRVIAGEGLTQLFATAPGAVRQFQIHQLADHSIVVRVVSSGADDAPGAIRAAVDRLAAMTSGSVPVSLELVADIPHDRGKVRYIRSDVAKRPTA